MLCVGQNPFHYIPKGQVTWGTSHGSLDWGGAKPGRGFHKGHSLANPYNQDQDWKEFVGKIERLDNKAESTRIGRQMEKAKIEAESKLGGRHYRVPAEKRCLRTARETLLRTAPALEGPRLTDLGTEDKLRSILSNRTEFHTFEDQLRISMETALFHKRAQTAQTRVDDMITTQRYSRQPAALRRGQNRGQNTHCDTSTHRLTQARLSPLPHAQPWFPGQPQPNRPARVGRLIGGSPVGSKRREEIPH
mmetsp:Transcript_32628/g.52538  ORF Transcript_32628/g.52538 Transcript_32628/m.52538 type:complete len:248 (-) Transcript_32628:222-965(-)|eukprot:CAMPEP_0179428858 /NCGR_PEP_ID=MMETSP0799-20121207/14411_1 /TAXON_ID=46947 /ORGANISM="Geminigera cryophila, Strain CCMP2564" /LENGTH=247 /DNA_ID=CAMNT_0021204535 /DNA_START=81 /DNA_END=824 /DNA_ORIENTATION=-